MRFKFMCIIFAVTIVDVQCKRFKRVFNGEQFNGRPTTYDVIRYYAAMASAHSTPRWTWLTWIWNYGSMICSGALLTPSIYQTACHCLTDFSLEDQRTFRPPLRHPDWESRAVIYPGVSHRYGEESFVTYDPIPTKKFLVHSKCAGIGSVEVATYDYGIVIMNDEWISRKSPYPWAEIRWAPTYTEQNMKEFHKRAVIKQLVCMIIGFGWTQREVKSTSEHLLHGWGRLLSRNDCLRDRSISWLRYDKKMTTEDVFKYFNWVCTTNFSQHEQESGPGDSGGPFTCDNTHYGVLSGRRLYITDKIVETAEFVGKHHLLVRTTYSNAVDYRKFFIRNIHDSDINILYVRSLHPNDHPLKHKGMNWLQTVSPAMTSFGLDHTPPLLSFVLVAVLKSLIE